MSGLADETTIIEGLRLNGLAMVPDFVTGSALTQLIAEFDSLFAGSMRGVSPMKRHPSGPAARIRFDRLGESCLPVITSVFRSPALERIARAYLPEGSTFNDQLVATHDRLSVPIAATHFDMKRMLKFYVYLLDADESNGALQYAVGTRGRNSRDRGRFLALGGRLVELGNIPAPGEDIPLVSFPGRAGTLLIFDTEAWHGAGVVSQGEERKILRAASVFAGQPSKKARFASRQWLRESRFNPNRQRAGGVFPPGRRNSAGTARIAD